MSRYRVGDVGSGSMPASIKIAAPNGDVATLAVKKWVGNGGETSPGGFIKDFNTHYVTPRESYAKMRELHSEFPNITQLYDLPNKTNGYQRKSQAIVGLATPYDGGTVASQRRPTDPLPSVRVEDQPRAIVLTSKAYGQQGGNNIKVSIVNAGASKPLTVSVAASTITVQAATDDAGAITSTATQVIDAINASEPAAALVIATKYRTAGRRFVVATPRRR